jgi:GH35 family endo-1,4-beta-xylanase
MGMKRGKILRTERLVLVTALSLLAIGCFRQELTEEQLDARIETLRKGDFEFKLTVKGKPFTGKVSYELVRHDFSFGTCVDDRVLLKEGADGDKYRDVLKQYFNSTVDRFRMKWNYMEPEQGVHEDEIPLKNFGKCEELGLPMRGHCIFWGLKNRPQWVKSLSNNDLRKAMKDRAEHLLTLFRGKILEWDCNNEMIHGDAFKRAVPNQAEYFKICKRIDPDVALYVNDYKILSSRKTCDKYINHIKQLLADGADLGGIGCQGHFGTVPPNREIWRSLDKLAQFGLPIKITEFDVKNSQADGLKRFYKTCFAHPGVHGILMWGFWAGSHWRPDAALWAEDWSMRSHGREYVRLITEEWVSRGTVQATPEGTIRFRGFYGTYKITAGGKTHIRTFRKRALEE